MSARTAALALVLSAALLTAASPATAATGPPVGAVDLHLGMVILFLPSMALTGWAADPDQPHSAIYVRADVIRLKNVCNRVGLCSFRVSFQTSMSGLADVARSQPPLPPPSYGQSHGFSLAIPWSASESEQVCLTALNVGAGSDTPLGCYEVVLGIS